MFKRGLLLVGAVAAMLGAPAVSSAASNWAASQSAKSVGWNVQFAAGVSDKEAARVLSAAGAKATANLPELHTSVVKLAAGRETRAVADLKADPRVVSVQQDGTDKVTIVPRDPHWTQAWGPRLVHAPDAWTMSTGRATTVIAIIDTGVDPRQPDLRGRVLRGWDFVNNDSSANDDNGHGTAVAGVAAAAGNDRVGIAGMCWQCRILPVKVLNAAGSGSHSDIAAGIVYATRHGADVINMSLAGPYSATIIASAVSYARNHGVVVVAAAGNEGMSRQFYPAAYPGVISVGASTGSDALYSWSNRGNWVDVSAPGCALTGKPGPAWTWWCGTSFASPVVAGIAALIKSYRPGLSRSQIEQTLLLSTGHVRGISRGRIDAVRALRRAASIAGTAAEPTTMTWQGRLQRTQQRQARTVSLAGTEHVHLTWSNNETLWLTFKDASGTIVRSLHNGSGDISVQLANGAGRYVVTVGTFADATTDFKLTFGN